MSIFFKERFYRISDPLEFSVPNSLDDYESLDKIKTECDSIWKDEMPEFLLRNNSLILKHVIHSNIELFINNKKYNHVKTIDIYNNANIIYSPNKLNLIRNEYYKIFINTNNSNDWNLLSINDSLVTTNKFYTT